MHRCIQLITLRPACCVNAHFKSCVGLKSPTSVQHLQAQVGDGLEAIAQLQQRLASSSAAQAHSSSTADSNSSQHPGAAHAQQGNSSPMSNASSPSQGPVSHDSWPIQHLHLLVVDAGSGDASVAMSCPPAPFLESRFLGHAKQVLRHGGMMAVNCVSRAAEPFKAAVKALQVGTSGNCLISCWVLAIGICSNCLMLCWLLATGTGLLFVAEPSPAGFCPVHC